MNTLFYLAGLDTLKTTLINSWIGPAFLILVAAIAVKFVMQRQFRELATFTVVVIIVALFIFNGDKLFGNKGTLTGIGEDLTGQITGNFILPFMK